MFQVKFIQQNLAFSDFKTFPTFDKFIDLKKYVYIVIVLMCMAVEVIISWNNTMVQYQISYLAF